MQIIFRPECIEELGDSERIIQALNNLGITYIMKGNYGKALEVGLRSLKLAESRAESVQDWRFLAGVLQVVGSTFGFQGNDEQVLAHLQRAVAAADRGISVGQRGCRYSNVLALAGIGEIYLQQRNHPLAREYYQNGLKLMEAFPDEMEKAFRDSLVAKLKGSIGNTI